MNNSNNDSKFIAKMVILVIVVIINIIALTGVFITVGQTISNLKEELASGKISKSTSQAEDTNVIDDDLTQSGQEMDEEEMELNIDTSGIINAIMKDSNAIKSVVLMAIALVLLAIAIFILVKLK